MLKTKYAGVGACVALAVLATWLGTLQNIIGAPMLALVFGMAANNLCNPGAEFLKGSQFCAKKVLNIAIVLAGATLSIKQIMGIGGRALPLLVFNVLLVLAVTYFFARKMKVDWNTATLVGSGTAICGGTAIASVASVIKATEHQIAYAMTSIFLFDILAAFSYPYLSVWLGLSNTQFAVLAGAAVNDTSSVTAAEQTFNALTGADQSLALTVKLTRTLLLVALTIAFSLYSAKKNAAGERLGLAAVCKKAFPSFILLFLLAVALNSLGLFGMLGSTLFGSETAVISACKTTYKFLVAVALCGVGFKMKFRDILTKGLKPLALGGIAWAAIFVSTLCFVLLFSGYLAG